VTEAFHLQSGVQLSTNSQLTISAFLFRFEFATSEVPQLSRRPQGDQQSIRLRGKRPDHRSMTISMPGPMQEHNLSSSGPDHQNVPPCNAERNRYFTLSVASSANSSRAPSPTPFAREKSSYIRNGEAIDTPRRQTDVYEATLPWWRAATRRRLVKSVQWESKVIARMQVSQLSAMVWNVRSAQ
jgi:hypothetical protein